MNSYHDAPRSVEELEEMLSRPSQMVVEALQAVEGDVLVLGAGGKMGPSLAVMARRAVEMAGADRRVMAASRFTDSPAREYLERHGVETLVCDLLAPGALDGLPDAANIIFMAGMKFGAARNSSLTWAMNVLLPGLVGARWCDSRAVVFSTGNVYGLTAASEGGSEEDDIPDPRGEYAMSTLGRERVFEYYAFEYGLAQSVIRLNYACDLRYGVLVDVAYKVLYERPVPLGMGYLNTIWQGDANAMALASLAHASIPPQVLNVTGSRILRVREAARYFGKAFNKTPIFEGEEATDALLSDNSKAAALFGAPSVDEETLMSWVAAWVRDVGVTLNKPTHFESRDGKF